jgi:predicted DNA-binding protein with PD1-like motif
MEQPLKPKETQCSSNKFTKARGQRTFAVVLEAGEELMDCLKRFVASEKMGAVVFPRAGLFR